MAEGYGYPQGGHPPVPQQGPYPPPPQQQGPYPPPPQQYGQGGYPPPPQYGNPPQMNNPAIMQPQPMGMPMQQMQQQQQYMPSNVPPGLDYLVHVDQLIVKQKVEWLEAICGCETKNKYKVLNSMGQQIYKASEDNNCCTRNCLGANRPFDMELVDNNGTELIHLYRPFRCTSCFFPCFLQEMEVHSPPGTIIGTIEQEWSIVTPQYVVKDQNGDVALRIEGPLCTFSLCGDVEFNVLSPDGLNEVGKISKQWSGLLKETFTDADIFGISFPMDLDVRMKAVLLGACFLIDFNYFEKAQNKEGDNIGMFD